MEHSFFSSLRIFVIFIKTQTQQHTRTLFMQIHFSKCRHLCSPQVSKFEHKIGEKKIRLSYESDEILLTPNYEWHRRQIGPYESHLYMGNDIYIILSSPMPEVSAVDFVWSVIVIMFMIIVGLVIISQNYLILMGL